MLCIQHITGAIEPIFESVPQFRQKVYCSGQYSKLDCISDAISNVKKTVLGYLLNKVFDLRRRSWCQLAHTWMARASRYRKEGR